MTDATGAANAAQLSTMRVADLQAMASQLGIRGAARMRKVQLIEAIQAAGDTSREAQAGAADGSSEQAPTSGAPKTQTANDAPTAPAEEPASDNKADADNKGADDAPEQANSEDASRKSRSGRGNRRRVSTDPNAGEADAKQTSNDAAPKSQTEANEGPLSLDDIVLPTKNDDADSDDDNAQQGQGRKRNRNRNRNNRDNNGQSDSGDERSNDNDRSKKQDRETQDREASDRNNNDRNNSDRGNNERNDNDRGNNDRNNNDRGNKNDRGNQNRQRERNKRDRRDDVDPEIAPDDVLLPIAGILDVLDNYAFVRTSGYLPNSNDVYVSLGQVKKYGLRKGDAIVGAIRQPREGEQQHGRQKYNALVKIDTINGQSPEQLKDRPEFDSLTPLYPDERLSLEAPNGHAAQRMIDLFAPIGKGSRGMIVAPPKSGKSIILERIANAIAQNSPDTHLMIVLVDERPEEVTRLERTIHGEVVASTFDMPAENHTTIAELAIERAKRLVELGLDVVVLLDSITQLGRAYNLTAPASGRIIAGGVDASALYPPKRFFGAARKVENGGSLTILATAMVETGSRTDEVILEEFAGTANMELRLSREIADRRIFPAVDIQQSSTLHENLLLTQEELEATWAIRRMLNGDAQGALESVLERLSSTSTNDEFVKSVLAKPLQAGR